MTTGGDGGHLGSFKSRVDGGGCTLVTLVRNMYHRLGGLFLGG